MSDSMHGNDGTPAQPAGSSSVIPFPPRRRSFVAAPPPPPAPAPAAPAGPLDFDLSDLSPESDDDIPVLTEVVDLASVSADAPDEHEAGPDLEALRETLADTLATELAHSIEQRLATELPSLVEATLANLQDNLKAGIIAATEAALKDFIARRQQLQLPFDPPAPGN